MSKGMMSAARSAATAMVAVAVAALLCFVPSVTSGIQLLTSTLLVMGGNTNPQGLTPAMQQQLGGDPWYPEPDPDVFRPVGTYGDGYIDAVNNTASPYYGWDFRLVEWPAQLAPIAGSWPYEQSQQQGVHNIDNAINRTLPTLGPGERVLAFGYSSSANVMVREMRQLMNQPGGPTATDQLEFMVIANPNRPNGGILQRFVGLYIPILGIKLDGSTPVDTPYQMTDISWEYDPASDFPNYPVNLLADLNSLVASMLHGNYYPADMNGPRAFPDTTVDNITYVTLAPPHLPLLLPLYYVGFPKPLLDLVEPALTVMVDWGYNRSISPGTPRTAQLIPRISPCTAIADLGRAVLEGAENFIDDLKTVHTGASQAKPARAGSARTPATKDDATPTGARTGRAPKMTDSSNAGLAHRRPDKHAATSHPGPDSDAPTASSKRAA